MALAHAGPGEVAFTLGLDQRVGLTEQVALTPDDGFHAGDVAGLALGRSLCQPVVLAQQDDAAYPEHTFVPSSGQVILLTTSSR